MVHQSDRTNDGIDAEFLSDALAITTELASLQLAWLFRVLFLISHECLFFHGCFVDAFSV